jgi:ABC-type polysaccharide/polyol phosphate transport system ATPase subunit
LPVVPTSGSPVVVVDGVSKRFRLPHERVHTLKERALHPFRRSGADRFEALSDVSFAVERGEFFGIVGRNGSGKSTLLKCLAGIYRVDEGAIYLDGRLSTFIELGVGFNPDLPARDNVLINGVMLGLSPSEARARYEQVIDFAELREFEELKLKNYSSGMQVRLAFSVMVQVDADVLLIDEVLAVGDAAFQQKCFDVFNRLRDEGRTILFVTHDMGAVRRFCHRAVLLERGRLRLIGDPAEVGLAYTDLNFAGRDDDSEAIHQGAGEAEIVEAWWEDELGERRAALRQGQVATFRARVRFHRPVTSPAVAVVFENERRQPLMATSTDWTRQRTGEFAPGDEAEFSVSFDLVFAPGRVHATPWVAQDKGRRLLDRRPRLASVVVTGEHESGGLVDLPHEVQLRTADRALTGRAGE